MKITITFSALLATDLLVVEANWPLRADNVDDIPADFDCAMRQAAYAHGKELLPRMGKFESLYYALDLNDPTCPPTEMAPNPDNDLVFDANGDVVVDTSGMSIPAGSVFVAPEGGVDKKMAKSMTGLEAMGTEQRPFATIQFGLDVCSERSDCSAVVLRGGTHYLTDTIMVKPKHSHTTMMAYPGEAPVVSGGILLKDVDFKPYGQTNNSWQVDVRSQLFLSEFGRVVVLVLVLVLVLVDFQHVIASLFWF